MRTKRGGGHPHLYLIFVQHSRRAIYTFVEQTLTMNFPIPLSQQYPALSDTRAEAFYYAGHVCCLLKVTVEQP